MRGMNGIGLVAIAAGMAWVLWAVFFMDAPPVPPDQDDPRRFFDQDAP